MPRVHPNRGETTRLPGSCSGRAARNAGTRPASACVPRREPATHTGREVRKLAAALRSPTFIIDKRYLFLRAAGRDAKIRRS